MGLITTKFSQQTSRQGGGRPWTRALVGATLCAAALILTPGCGGSGGGATAPNGLPFVFDISNTWFSQVDPTHEFSLNADSPPSDIAGTFSGTETLPSGVDSPLSGSFTGNNVQFTVQRAGGSVTFSGHIINQNRMEVTGAGTSLVILR